MPRSSRLIWAVEPLTPAVACETANAPSEGMATSIEAVMTLLRTCCIRESSYSVGFPNSSDLRHWLHSPLAVGAGERVEAGSATRARYANEICARLDAPC